MPQRLTVVLSFDMETDIGSWTSGTLGIRAGTPAILGVLKRHRVPATFFFVGREALAHADAVRAIAGDGHEVGCHTMFHETVGTPVYDVPVGGFMVASEIEARLAMATDAVAEAAGTRPVSFRAPRLFGSSAMVRALERLGYQADSSLPAYVHGRGFAPYHPAPDDWTRAGAMRILEAPVFYDTSGGSGPGADRGRDQWPMLRLNGGEWFAGLAQRVSCGAPLVVYLHPWEFVPMPATHRTDECAIAFDEFLHRNTGAYALAALDEFVGRMAGAGAAFVTMRELAAGFPGPGTAA